jgi:hypothetical protein
MSYNMIMIIGITLIVGIFMIVLELLMSGKHYDSN